MQINSLADYVEHYGTALDKKTYREFKITPLKNMEPHQRMFMQRLHQQYESFMMGYCNPESDIKYGL